MLRLVKVVVNKMEGGVQLYTYEHCNTLQVIKIEEGRLFWKFILTNSQFLFNVDMIYVNWGIFEIQRKKL